MSYSGARPIPKKDGSILRSCNGGPVVRLSVLGLRVPGHVGGDCDRLRKLDELGGSSPRESVGKGLESVCSSFLRMDCLAVSCSSRAEAVWLGALGGGIGAASDCDDRSSGPL